MKSLRMLRRSCIKGSLGASALGAIEMPLAARLWRDCEGLVLAPSRFMADVLERDGRVGRVEYLENPWPAVRVADNPSRDCILYMARLAPEKGIRLALTAWSRVAAELPHVRFRVAGHGSEAAWVRDYIARHSVERVDLLGALDSDRIDAELSRALLTVHPAVWHDNSPLSVRESLCAGVPAAVSDLGGAGELVGAGRGPILRAGDEGAWAAAMVEAVRARLAGTPRFVASVNERWYGAHDHLERLGELYEGR
jgi:glycosyltransferase involved in cell wall biosynthesis